MPEALSELLNYGGFLMLFTTTTSDDGSPLTELHVLRRDALAATAPKAVYLAATDVSGDLDPTQNNVSELHLSRDVANLVNAFRIHPFPESRGDVLSGPVVPAGRRRSESAEHQNVFQVSSDDGDGRPEAEISVVRRR